MKKFINKIYPIVVITNPVLYLAILLLNIFNFNKFVEKTNMVFVLFFLFLVLLLLIATTKMLLKYFKKKK